jgi:hypothetical protein
VTRGGLAALLVLCLASCDDPKAPAPPVKPTPPISDPAASIEFTQILLAYVPVRELARTKTHDEAFSQALRLIARAKAGERFENLVVEATDDLGPDGKPFNDATVTLALKGPGDPKLKQYVLRLKVGEVGETPYDAGNAILVVRRDR